VVRNKNCSIRLFLPTLIYSGNFAVIKMRSPLPNAPHCFVVNPLFSAYVADYKIMKSKCENKIVRLEAQLKELKDQANAKTDVSDIVDEALKRFEKLTELYFNGDIDAKRYIIRSFQKSSFLMAR
jgi:hypothetical protein